MGPGGKETRAPRHPRRGPRSLPRSSASRGHRAAVGCPPRDEPRLPRRRVDSPRQHHRQPRPDI